MYVLHKIKMLFLAIIVALGLTACSNQDCFAGNIKETGNYTVKITGKEAKGHISFSRQEGLQ